MDEYKNCPYCKPNSYQTKPIECAFCGHNDHVAENKIRAAMRRLDFLDWYFWCEKCGHYMEINQKKYRIPTMVKERLAASPNCFQFKHECISSNIYVYVYDFVKCSNHGNCWISYCKSCRKDVHVKEDKLPSKALQMLKNKVSDEKITIKPPAKSPFGVDRVY